MQNRIKDKEYFLLLILAFLLGGWFRIMPSWLAGFPVNDGGMFYTMMNDLQVNNFIPPLYTTYNQSNIPFAYPPLALYIGATLSHVLNISELDILQWLPSIINTFTIPAFFFLAKEIIVDRFKCAIATVIFAFTPHLYEWLSMGGGLTRSFGTIFMMLTAIFSYRMFTHGHNKYVLPTILFGSLTALSHTESIIFAIMLPIIFWFFTSRSIHGVKLGILTAIGVLIFAGPWYLLVIYKHGFDPYLSALRTGGQNPFAFLLLFNFREITSEPIIDLIAVTGFLGLVFHIAKKEYIIPILYIAMYLIQPRSAHTIVNIPLAMAAGVFFTDVLLPGFKKRTGLILGLVIPLTMANSIYQIYVISLNAITKDERSAFAWVADNTPEDGRFLVLTGEPLAFCDSTSEWFPALAERQSITTIQGQEWVSGNDIHKYLARKSSLEKCLIEGLKCLEQELGNIKMDYVYIANYSPTINCNQSRSQFLETNPLIIDLKKSSKYVMQYESTKLVVFMKVK